MTDTLNVYQALAQSRVDFQQKGDFKKVKSEGLKFAYLPIEAAKPIIEECTSKYGVTIIPTSAEITTNEVTEKKNSYGDITLWRYLIGTVHFDIVGPSGDKIEMEILAEAKDNSDKSINKLYTCAYKNLVKIVFGFAESPKDDPDATQEDNVKSEPQKRTPPTDDPFFQTADKVKIEKKEAKKESPKDPTIIQSANAPKNPRATMEKLLDKKISKDLGICVKMNEWCEMRGFNNSADLNDSDFEQMLIDIGVML